MNVSVAEVLAGAEVRAVPLSAECVGYLLLAAADQICAAPRRVAPSDLLLFDDGAVRVSGGRAADASLAECDLRGMLDALLLRASAPSTGLLRASRRPAGAGVEAFVRELETALIPVNRAAAKRSLARLERETLRAIKSGRITLPPAALEPSEAPPAVTLEPSAPLPNVTPEPSVALPAATPEPSVALPLVTPGPSVPLSHEMVAVAPAQWEVEPDSDAETPALLPERTVVLAKVAPREQLEGSRAESGAELVETRPEPVVLRKSTRPPAAPSASEQGFTEPLPTVMPRRMPQASAIAPMPVRFSPLPPSASPNVTPILGTRIIDAGPMPTTSLASTPSAPPIAASPLIVIDAAPVETLEPAEAAELDAALEPLADSDDDFEIEVELSEQDRTVMPNDEELIYSQGSDWTEPCPPLEAESMLPPPTLQTLVSALAGFAPVQPLTLRLGAMVALPETSEPPPPVVGDVDMQSEPPPPAHEDEAITLPPPARPRAESSLPPPSVAPEIEPSTLPPAANTAPSTLPPASDVAPSEVPPSVAPSELPPWVTAAMAPEDFTPPPRVPLPSPRPSDVSELLQRMTDEPLAVDDIRSSLKLLAGLDPTPGPPAVFRSE